MSAYEQIYLERASASLGRAFDWAANDAGWGLDEFSRLFAASPEAAGFCVGEPRVLAGMSGVELARAALRSCGLEPSQAEPRYAVGRSEEYWTGWIAARYQWARALTFSQLFDAVSAREIQSLYHPYHEMDVRQAVECLDGLVMAPRRATRLQERRKGAGLTQRQLAEASGVPLRTVQQYEQRQKNINAARADCVVAMARALACGPETLLEYDSSRRTG